MDRVATKDDVVDREISDVRCYLEDVGTAATAMPGSTAYVGVQVSARQLRQVVDVTCRARGACELLLDLWWRLRQPGLINLLRRTLMRGPMLRQLRAIRSQLDVVRVGHHPRWGKWGG